MAVVVEILVLAVKAGIVAVLVVLAEHIPFNLTKKESKTSYVNSLEEIRPWATNNAYVSSK